MKTVEQFKQQYESSDEGMAKISGMRRVIEHLQGNKRSTTIEVPETGICFGLFGDTHNGSLYEDIGALNAYTKEAVEAGAQCFLHAGDCLEGHKLYKGQEFETHARGWNEQKKHWAKVSPRTGLDTYFITGNHDASLKKLAGINVGEGLAEERKDYKYIGEDQGTIVLKDKNGNKCTVMLLHPGGGSAYALSYRPQKIVEQIEGGTKPNILGIGNYHKAEWIPSYRNVSVFQVGCFQRQTPFMLSKGLSAHVGGWIIKAGFKRGVANVESTFIAFY